jgi:hypothetical protein
MIGPSRGPKDAAFGSPPAIPLVWTAYAPYVLSYMCVDLGHGYAARDITVDVVS